jgi:hypothetical protein
MKRFRLVASMGENNWPAVGQSHQHAVEQTHAPNPDLGLKHPAQPLAATASKDHGGNANGRHCCSRG